VEIKIATEHYNPLLKRKEILVTISHQSTGTPDRFGIRKQLAARYNSKLEATYVTKMKTKTGTNETICKAHVYDSPEWANRVEPKFIKNRNLPAEERKVLAKAKKPVEKVEKVAPKAAKPTEEKKPVEGKK
jgi:small subunit ribosomal protein S24e